MGTKKSITTEALIGKIAEITAFVDAELEAAGCPLKQQMQIDVAIDELFSNIARYAYPAGNGTMTFRFETEPASDGEHSASVHLTFIDQGGLGIHIAKHLMDDACYEYKDGRNILRLRKDLT